MLQGVLTKLNEIREEVCNNYWSTFDGLHEASLIYIKALHSKHDIHPVRKSGAKTQNASHIKCRLESLFQLYPRVIVSVWRVCEFSVDQLTVRVYDNFF